MPPPVRNPTGPTSARENALEARELALEERLRYVEACVEINQCVGTRAGSVER